MTCSAHQHVSLGTHCHCVCLPSDFAIILALLTRLQAINITCHVEPVCQQAHAPNTTPYSTGPCTLFFVCTPSTAGCQTCTCFFSLPLHTAVGVAASQTQHVQSQEEMAVATLTLCTHVFNTSKSPQPTNHCQTLVPRSKRAPKPYGCNLICMLAVCSLHRP